MITALISIYHPDSFVKELVRAIAAQVDRVCLCDNSPSSNAGLFTGADMPGNLHYTCFGENLGLSAAFNRILKDDALGWQEDDFVIFFDQDSQIVQGHIAKLLAVFGELTAKAHPVGCLGCVFFNTNRGAVEVPRAKKQLLEGTYAVTDVITSSMLCTYGALQRVDFWNERVFLDMADWDLCWRLQKAGLLCCITEKAVLHHTLGIGEKKIGPLTLRVGQPIREYYQIRECMHLLTRRYTPMKYRLRFLAMLFIRSPLHILFLDHRKQRLSYITKGFLDFFRGKQGAL